MSRADGLTVVPNQMHYQARKDSPSFSELHGLVVKTVGIVESLREALRPLAGRIHAAFVYGSIAKGSDPRRKRGRSARRQ